MARQLFDPSIFSVVASSGAIGVGWKLHFYTGGTATPITTWNARTSGSANANPVIADASGRFPVIWIDDAQTVKWVLADDNDVVKETVDDYLIVSAASIPTIAPGLVNFLAGTAPLPLVNGGSASSTGPNACVAIGAVQKAGDTVTGNIVRSGKGIHPYFNAAAMTGGQIFIQAAGADPTSNPGDIVFEY